MVETTSENKFGINDIYGRAIIEVKKMRFHKVREIGEKLIMEYQNGNISANGYDDIFERIDEIKKEIVLNNKKKIALQGSIVCEECKNMLPLGSMFCNRCGAKQTELDKEVMDVLKYKVCPQCGEVMEFANQFCGRCGLRF